MSTKKINPKEAIDAACDIMFQELEQLDEETDDLFDLISDIFNVNQGLPDNLEILAPEFRYVTLSKFGR